MLPLFSEELSHCPLFRFFDFRDQFRVRMNALPFLFSIGDLESMILGKEPSVYAQ
jgi:hypothetical protein